MLTKLITACWCLCLGMCAVNFCLTRCNAWINTSSSLPRGVYISRSLDRPLHAGDLVLACVPASHADFAYRRGYLQYGKCPGGYAPVGKHVVAVGGDRVRIDGAGIAVNDRLLPGSAPQAQDVAGRALWQATVKRRLSAGELVLANAGTRSFDSRYFGTVAETAVIGRLRPLWVAG